MRRWTQTEIDWLRSAYPDRPTVGLARELGRSTSSVESKAVRLGLKKTRGYLERMGRELVGRRKDRQ